MAVLFMDSFDHLATATIGQKWDFGPGGGDITANGRNSTQCFQTGVANVHYLYKNVTPASATGVAGFALQPLTMTGTSFASVYDSGGTRQLSFCTIGTGYIEVRRGAFNGTLLGTTSSALSASYHYVEFKWTIDNSAGAVEVRINGSTVLTLTSVDTQSSANASWGAFVIGTNVNEGFGSHRYDDFYLLDTSGSSNTDFLGPIRVKALYADGAGNSTDFTPSAGSNYQNVDEATSDSDTTYNSEGTVGDHDTYTFGSVGLTGTVRAVQTNVVVRSDGAGSETVAPMVRIDGTDYEGDALGVNTTYRVNTQVYEVSPDTSTAWTVSEIDGTEFGVKLVS